MILLLSLIVASVSSCSISDLSCPQFILPDQNITALVSSLCVAMPGMVGCSLKKVLTTASPMNIYGSICVDMPSMTDCSTYKRMLANGVLQANEVIKVLDTKTTTKLVYSICSEMKMDGCDSCSIADANTSYANCDLLTVYSRLCSSMPEMNQCSEFKKLCLDNPSISLCPNSSASLSTPTMQMYFHAGINEYILFQQWIPKTAGQYAGAWFSCFVAATIYELLHVCAVFLEIKWIPRDANKFNITKGSFELESEKIVPRPSISHVCGISDGRQGILNAFLRGMLRMVTTTLGYALMLVAMTFNIGLFFAIILGFGVGTFIFAPVVKSQFANGQRISECC